MKLFIALPVYGGYHPDFVHSLLVLMTRRPCHLVIRPCVGDSLVARARNRLCADFLASDCTHLLFIDTDLIFSVEHIAALVAHAERGIPMVCGLYAKKQRELAWVCNLLDEAQEPDADGLQKVKYAGTGCMMFSRQVLEVMRAALKDEIEYDPDDGDTPGVKWDFFGTGVRKFGDRRRYLSEDWLFCQRVLEMGYDIWMDTRVVLKHVGEAVYPLQEIESFAEKVDVAEGSGAALTVVDGGLQMHGGVLRAIPFETMQRDANGFWDHPDLPWDQMTEEKGMGRWFAEMGYHCRCEHLQWEVSEAGERFWVEENFQVASWNPMKPEGEGWILVSIFDAESGDGPVAAWVRPAEATL